MDPGRYGLQQGWDNNSALKGYGAVHEPDFRSSASYAGRRYLDEGFSRDPSYGRNTFHRDTLEQDIYPSSAPVSVVWSQSRRRGFDDDYGLIRGSRRHEKPYVESFHEMDNFHDVERYRGVDSFHETDKYRENYRSLDNYRVAEYAYDDRHGRFGARDRDEIDNLELRHHPSHQNRDGSHEKDHDYERYSYDSDHERRRDTNWRRRESRDHDRDKRDASRERDPSPYRHRERSRSHGRSDRSRSPRSRSRGRSQREDSYDDVRYERSEKRRDRDEKRHAESSVAPSATVVVKGLSQKTSDEDLYQILAEWAPLRHVRVIKERNTGVSRGFAFIDFPTVEAACKMMDTVGEDGLVIDGRKLIFEYSSKPTSGAGVSFGLENNSRSGYVHSKISVPPSDWMCLICGCVNFARRTSCFQCNEARSDDAPPADVITSNPTPLGKKGSDLGPTHVLVVRGLDENADEEMLRYEFSKHVPIKDLRLVRDKFTHVSRGFAFVHFYSVEDATKALEVTNGITLEKNGQILRVAYAKSIHGPGSGALQSSSLAAAAIEAATFAQQYDAVGWAPKEYNPDEKQAADSNQMGGMENQEKVSAPQSGFVWDEKSGYYYDAASGFYYDGNTGLYYDGNNSIWYSYDNQNQKYVPCTDQNGNKSSGESANLTSKNEASKISDSLNSKKVIISAPAITTTKSNEKTSLPDAVQAAAAAALAAEKKEKEKLKEIKLASKSSLLANKKKMNNVLAMWKQRNHEGQAARVVLDDSHGSEDKPNNSYSNSSSFSTKSKLKSDFKDTTNSVTSTAVAVNRTGTNSSTTSLPTQISSDSQNAPRPVSNSAGGTLMGVIRGSGRGVIKSDTTYPVSSSGTATTSIVASSIGISINAEPTSVLTPFKTDASALGSYATPSSAGSGKRRFSEMPVPLPTQKDQSQTVYRDRAAERRSLYGASSSSFGDEQSDHGIGDQDHDCSYRRGSSDFGGMPFPPGVGGRPAGDIQSYDVITVDRALDESNVGNRMLRNMGWQEGLGLGKDGSGIKEPVQAKAVDDRAGLGSQQRKTVDPSLEAQAGDSYKTIIQKKAIARFREMA